MNEQASRFAKFTSLIHPQRRDAVESLIQMRAEFVENLRLMQEQLATRKKEIESFDFLIDSITKSIEATEETGAMPPGKAIESPKAAPPRYRRDEWGIRTAVRSRDCPGHRAL